MIKNNKVYNENCLSTMSRMEDGVIDLTVTSPPYDDVRTYTGFTLPLKEIATELYRVTKEGGVVVWVVNDKTKNYCESLTSFKTAILFVEEAGFNLHDTMIYKRTCAFPDVVRYYQDFEYMFVFAKGKPKTVNLLRQPKTEGTLKRQKNKTGVGGERQTDGSLKRIDNTNGFERKERARKDNTRVKSNVWELPRGNQNSTKDKIAFKHPAIFPEQLANDHIISWSNVNDIVYDCFGGSGTTAKMAELNKRKWIISEISTEYCAIIKQRMRDVRMQTKLF
uniref:site-specific DNA-methyltransferase (cytosine-N(4)-specific) n=1 Tax=uncultured marine virus TaxID=186617 RepID=A0A0F7L4N7_9VIRU|nr:Modification methylase BamHII [uncultured marine virus]